MKKVIFTLLCMAVAVITQAATYYWVPGGSGSWTNANNWSSTSGGAAGAGTPTELPDVAIFDAASGTVAVQVTDTITSLQVLTGANLTLNRTASGTSSLSLSGGLTVQAGATLTLTSPTAAWNVALILFPTSVSNIYGNVTISGAGSNRITPQAAGILLFQSGSALYASVTGSSSIFGSTSQAVDRGARFLAGSHYYHRTTVNPFPNSTTNNLVLEPLSNFHFESPIFTNSIGNRQFGNVIIGSNYISGSAVAQSITFNGNPYYIDSLIVEAGNTLFIREQSQTPVAGSIIVNAGATFGANTTSLTSSHLQMIGTGTLQTIGGSGTIAPLGTLSIGKDANVRLDKSIVLNGTSTGNVTGRLDVGTNTIGGTANFQFRAPSSVTSTATTVAGSNTVTLANFAASNISIGLLLAEAGGGTSVIPANTYIVNTSSSSGTATLSKPALTSGTISITTSSNAATLITNNTGGVDGSIVTTGTKSFGSMTNYTFNAATNTPFATSSNNDLGNVVFNAATTTNKNVEIAGVLNLNSGKLTVRDVDTLTISKTGTIGASSATNYIALTKGATNSAMLLKDTITGSMTLPIGTATRYLPVTIAPSVPTAFYVSTFEGVTAEGTVNGTAFSAGQKAEIVDAIWIINRRASDLSTDPVALTVNWTSDLEGSNFAALSNAQIGVSRHNGTIWTIATGSGNNTTNTATSTFTNFSPFGVGRLGATLPISFKSITAAYANSMVNVAWQMGSDNNMASYSIERADNSLSFTQVGNIVSRNAIGSATYNFADVQPLSGNNFYRIKATAKNGEVKYSAVVKVNINSKGGFAVLQNPVRNGALQVSLANLSAGKYSISVINAGGQTVVADQFNYTGGSLSKTLSLPNAAKGVYNVILNNGTDVKPVRVIIE